MSQMLHLFLITLGLLNAVLVCGGVPEPACVVQLSDLHLSQYNTSQFHKFGDRLGDLKWLAKTVLKSVQPKALLITGDLTDGKSPAGAGRQSLSEWQDYRSFLEAVKTETALAEADILDLPGNHDTLNVASRSGQNDLYSRFSAGGRRHAARVFVKDIPSTTGCPKIVLIGIDLTQEPGLAGINFFGRETEDVLSDVKHSLEGIEARLAERGCRDVPVLAHGHFPLEVVTHPTPGRQSVTAAGGGLQSLKALLLEHNVTAFIAGHLHAAFGQRLHRLHYSKGGSYLAELETSAWLDDRRFRLMCFSGSSLAFTDLYFHTGISSRRLQRPPHQGLDPSSRGFAIASEDATQQVNNYIIMITSPPSASYSPLASVIPGDQRPPNEVTAVVFPVDPRVARQNVQVKLLASCPNGDSAGAHEMRKQQGAVWTVSAPDASCPGTIAHLQVVAGDGSCSARITVKLAALGKATPAVNSGAPLAIERSWMDELRALTLWMEWSIWGYWTMYGVWGSYFFGLLLVPGIGSRLGWRRSLQRWLASRNRLWRPLCCLLAYPFRILLDQASCSDVFLPQLLYSGYLGMGPWGAGQWLEGEPLGYFALNRLVYRKGSQRYAEQRIDTSITSVVIMVFYLIPMTLLCASVRSRLLRTPQSRRTRLLETILQLLCFVIVQRSGWRILNRFGYGPLGRAGFALSPGMAWAVPFYYTLLGWMLWKGTRAANSSCPEYRDKPIEKSK